MSLKTRMKKNIDKLNSAKCHYYKPHIVSIKSYQILDFLNKVTTFNEKVKILELFQQILYESIKPLYKNCSPNMVYTFLDEIHLVFFYNEYGNYIYDGNINKILTTMTSSISVNFCKQLQLHGIDLDFIFSGQIVEFDKDYETLNYLIWRQNDCKRNTLTLLYKCLKLDLDFLDIFLGNDTDSFFDLFLKKYTDSNIKLSEIKKNIDKILNQDVEISLLHLVRGSIIKKHQKIYYKIKQEEINQKEINEKEINDEDEEYDKIKDEVRVTRNILCVEHFLFTDDFSKNFEKYIKQLVMMS
jgi:hypothetical protein